MDRFRKLMGERQTTNREALKSLSTTAVLQNQPTINPSTASDSRRVTITGSSTVTDITDYKGNENSENITTQKRVGNEPVEQGEQMPMEGQTSNTQTEPRNRDPPHNTGKPVKQSNKRDVYEERRSSFPNTHSPENKPWRDIKHYGSEPLLSQMRKAGELELADPLCKSVRNNLDLLEGLARCLDKEHAKGIVKCWKHLAEHFGVKESTYKQFKCPPQNSPTENLFYFLKTQIPAEFTIGKLKDGLNSIERCDVIQDVLITHQTLDSSLTDETTVGSLFDSHPLVIGEIAIKLDLYEPGKQNWRQLSDKFDVPKSESQNFAECIKNNPTQILLETIECSKPMMTVGYLQEILEGLQMQEASDVLKNSTKVNRSTLLRDIWDKDDDAAENLCNLLNQRYKSRIRGWRKLGLKLKIKKDVLVTFSDEDEVISPTEALFNYLGGAQVRRTMEDLILALDSIGREDALSVVKYYFPGFWRARERNLRKQQFDCKCTFGEYRVIPEELFEVLSAQLSDLPV